MLSTFRAAVRPLVFVILFTVASAGTVLAESSYGGTDPPKANDAIAWMTGLVDGSADAASFWTQLSVLLVQWFAAVT